MLLRKQDDFNLDWHTQMEFSPTQPGQEAGTVVWLHAESHAVLALRGTSDNAEIVFRYPEGKELKVRSIDDQANLKEKTFSFDADSGTPIDLYIAARKDQYDFSYRLRGGQLVSVGRIATSSFVPLFTGVHIGIYAQGSGEVPCLNSAYFSVAEWETV